MGIQKTERNQRVISMYRAKNSQAKCARHFRLTQQRISMILKSNGVKIRAPGRPAPRRKKKGGRR